MRLLKTTFLICAAAATAHAGDKKTKTPAAPASVTVHNACKADLKVAINGQAFAVAAGKASADTALAPAPEGKGYVLTVKGAKDLNLGMLGFESGKAYDLKLADCRNGGADVYLDSKIEVPKGASPHAAAQVRFRAAKIGHIEYKAGKVGRFKPLSLGMTSYKEAEAGKFKFTLRLRAAKRGPVMGMLNKEVELKAGRNYLVEAQIHGRDIFFKREDEGFVKSKK
jgi:hypothetical protein